MEIKGTPIYIRPRPLETIHFGSLRMSSFWTPENEPFLTQKPYFFIFDHKNHLSTLGLIFSRLENAGPQSRFKSHFSGEV